METLKDLRDPGKRSITISNLTPKRAKKLLSLLSDYTQTELKKDLKETPIILSSKSKYHLTDEVSIVMAILRQQPRLAREFLGVTVRDQQILKLFNRFAGGRKRNDILKIKIDSLSHKNESISKSLCRQCLNKRY